MTRILLLLLLLLLPAQAAVGPITVTLNPGWNGVALQCSVVTSLSAPPEVAVFASYDGGTYATRSFTVSDLNVAGGKGLWVYASASTAFTYTGTNEAGNLNLNSGWNLVSFANPAAIAGSTLAFNGQSLTSQVVPNFQQINGVTYSGVDVSNGGVLQPGRAYWIFSRSGGLVTYTPGATPSPTPVPVPSPSPLSAGLQQLNQIRAQAGLPAVGENATLSVGAQLHAVWQILNNLLQAFETPGTPGYTAEGDLAAQQSNLTVSGTVTTLPQNINALMSAPFHGLLFIDPLLRNSGFGHATNTTPPRSSSVINVRGDRFATLPAGVTFPITWPGNGSTISIKSYNGGDFPDPLAGSGLVAPTGVPLYVLTGLGSSPPAFAGAELRRNGVALTGGWEIDENTYVNPNASDQALGRSVLRERNCIVLIPRDPLTPGQYQVTVLTNGQTIAWSFTVTN